MTPRKRSRPKTAIGGWVVVDPKGRIHQSYPEKATLYGERYLAAAQFGPMGKA